jgi:hypothetical protein
MKKKYFRPAIETLEICLAAGVCSNPNGGNITGDPDGF